MGRDTGHSEVSADQVTFTVEALATVPGDVELAKLSNRAGFLLHDWDNIDAEGRRLERAVIRASAHVRVADATLDAALSAFADDLLAVVSGNQESELYKRFFPEPHDEIVAMGLDSEVPEVTLIVHALDKGDETTPAGLRAHTDALRAGLKLGNGALAERADALADLGRHMARVEAWNETASSTLRSVAVSLARIAEKRKLPASWVEAFFNSR